MNPLLAEALGSIVRTGLAIGAGYVVSAGIWTPEDASKYVAAASVALLTLGWSLFQKYRSRVTLVTALASSQPMSEATAKSLKSIAPAVSTPQADIPEPKEDM